MTIADTESMHSVTDIMVGHRHSSSGGSGGGAGSRWIGAATKMAVVWFWATVCGTFYCGTTYVLPVLYADSGDALATIIRYLCYVMLAEMIVNWTCIRLASSHFRPEDHARYAITHAAEIADAGFEINLNHLKAVNGGGSIGNGGGSGGGSGSGPTANGMSGGGGGSGGTNLNGTYTLPASSVRSLDGNPCKRWNRDTMYIIAVPPDDTSAGGGCCGVGRDGCGDGLQSNGGGNGCGGSGGGGAVGRRVVYPYWSWKPCVVCQIRRPPRTHHCQLCNACVLKRDHHCFFTGCCIGLRNQRHFVVFVFWSTAAIAFSLVHGLAYVVVAYVPANSAWDLLLPVVVGRWLLGGAAGRDVVMCALAYSLVWFFATSVGFLVEQTRIIRRGVTSFEEENQIKVTNFNSVAENVRAVFGARCWPLNFVVPLNLVYPTLDNGVDWTNIKA